MEIRPSPNQEALIRQAVEVGRFGRSEDAVRTGARLALVATEIIEHEAIDVAGP